MKINSILNLIIIFVAISLVPVYGADPIATNDRYLVVQDDFINISAPGVLTNDYDADNDPLTAVLSLTTSHGALILQDDGSFSYTPDTGFNGKDTFTYFANDGADSNEATVELIVGKWYKVRSDNFEQGWGNMESGGPDAMIYTGTNAYQGTNAADVQDNSATESSFFYRDTIDTSRSFKFKLGFWHKAVGLEFVNTPPLVIGESYTIDQETELIVAAPGVLGNDCDIDGDPITAKVVSPVSSGTLTLNTNDGSFTYKPNFLFYGQDRFEYVVGDGVSFSINAAVDITVNWVNTPPISVTNSYQVYRNHIYSNAAPGVLGNDYDYDPQTITAHTQTQCTNGTVTLHPDGSFSYDPDPDFMGADSFEYYANDGIADGNIVTVYFYIVNKPPVATNDWYIVETNTTLNVAASEGVLVNDVDTDGHSITANLISDPKYGILTLTNNGGFTYTPTNSGFDGKDTFTYAANDGLTNGNVVTVDIMVGRWIIRTSDDFENGKGNYWTSLSETPAEIFTYSFNTNETNFAHSGSKCMKISRSQISNSAFYYKTGINTASYFEIQIEYWYRAENNNDATNDDFFVQYFNGSSWQDITNHAYQVDYVNDIYYSNKIIMNRDEYAFSGNWKLKFLADMNSDDYMYIDDVIVRVFSTNTGPVAVKDMYVAILNTTTNFSIPGVAGNDFDNQLDPIFVTNLTTPTFGTLLTFESNGSFTYDPDPGFNGVDYFTYQCRDSKDTGTTALVDITVGTWFDITYDNFETGWGNFKPGGTNGFVTLHTNTVPKPWSYEGDVSVLMIEDYGEWGDSCTLIYENSFNISLFEKLRVEFWYFADKLENQTKDFWLQIYDGTDWVMIGWYIYNVDFTNNGFFHDDIVIDKDDYVFATNMKLRFVMDAQGDSDYICIDDVRVSVLGGNAAPVAAPDSYSLAMNTTLIQPAPGVMSNDIDYNMDPITVTLSTDVANGTLTLDTDGSFTYSPNTFYTGGDRFSYKINDGEVDGNIVNVDLTIYWTNTPPIAVDTNYSFYQDTVLVVSDPGFIGNDTDYDTDPIVSAKLEENAKNGILEFNTDGSFTYEPNGGYVGLDSFTYRAYDGTDYSTNEGTVYLTVLWTNSAPVAVDDVYSVVNNTTFSNPAPGVLSNDIDINPQVLNAIPGADVNHGSLTLYSDGSFKYTPTPGYIGEDSFTYTVNDGVVSGNTATVKLIVTGWVELSCDNFESGWGNYGNGGSASRVSGSQVNNVWSIQLSGGSNSANSFSNNNATDVTGYEALKFTYWYKATGMDPGDGYMVQYYDGGVWKTIGDYYYVTDIPNNNTIYSNEIVIARGAYSFPENMGLRFMCNAPSPGNVFIDDVCIYGFNGVTNMPPKSTNDSYLIGKDIVLNIGAPGILGNDSDPEGEPLTASLVNPPNGTVTLNSNGSFSYRPAPHYFGSDSFTYRANDGINDGNVATVNITIDEWIIITYDDFESGWSNYYDGGLYANRHSGAQSPQGTYSANIWNTGPEAFFEYNVGHDVREYNQLKVNFSLYAESFESSDYFALEYFDGSKWITMDTWYGGGVDINNGSNPPQEVLINRSSYGFPDDMKIRFSCHGNSTGDSIYIDELKVSAIYNNVPPVAICDKYEVNQGETLEVAAEVPFSKYFYKEVGGVLVNDSDYENDPLIAVLDTDVQHGTLVLNDDGSFSYTPDPGFSGMDYFVYKANDGIDDSNPEKARIAVYPKFDDWVTLTYDTFETGLGSYSTSGSASRYSGVNSFIGDYSMRIENGAYIQHTSTRDVTGYCKIKVELWFKTVNYSGSDDFFIRYYDGGTWHDIADYDVDIDFNNGEFTYKRIIIGKGQYTFPANMRIRIAGSANSGEYLYADEIHVSALPDKPGTGLATLGEWALKNIGEARGDLNFPDVSYYVTRVEAASNRHPIRNATFIRGYLHPPETGNYTFRVKAERYLALWVNDDENTTPLRTIISEQDPASDEATGIKNNLVAGNKYYFEVANGSGADHNEYLSLEWDIPNVAGGFFMIEGDWISPVWMTNHPPVAYNDSYSGIDRNNKYYVYKSQSILNNDYDHNCIGQGDRRSDGDILEAKLIDDVNNGTLILNEDGSFIYTPNAGFTGSDSFRYIVYDGHHYSVPATVTLNVSDVNNAPVAVEDRYNVYSNTTLNVSSAQGVLANDSDLDGDSLTAILATTTPNGNLNLNANGSFSYNPNAGFWGIDSFTYRASAAGQNSDTVTVKIGVYNPDAPKCGVLREIWNGLTDGNIAAFTNLPDYPDNPDEIQYLSDYSVPLGDNGRENYGDRLRAYFIPKVTGIYKFLYGKASNDKILMRIYRSDENRDWIRKNTTSRLVLQKGEKYLIEIIHTDMGYPTWVYATWRLINEDTYIERIITCEYAVPENANSRPIVEDKEYMVFKNEELKMDSPGVLLEATDGEDDPIQAIQVSNTANGSLTLNSDGSFTYTPDLGFTGTDRFIYKANDGFSDSFEKTVTLKVVEGSNSNVKVSNWTYGLGSPSATLTAAARQMGFYAFADRAQDNIEIRGIRGELYAQITSSNIQAMVPWADISGPDYGICSMAFSPSGRLLFIGVCASPDSSGMSPEGRKDAVIRYNVNLKKYHLFDTLIIARKMNGQENYGMAHYRGMLFVGTENGMLVYNATRNVREGEIIENFVPSGNSVITGIDFDMFGEKVYFCTPDSLYRLDRFIPWVLNTGTHKLNYSERPPNEMELVATGSNFADITFGRSYGGYDTDGFYLLQKNSSDSRLYRIPKYDLRHSGEVALTAYTKFNKSINGIAATPCGRMLLASPEHEIMSDITDTRLNFEDFTVYQFSNIIDEAKANIDPDCPAFSRDKGWANGGKGHIFCIADNVFNDPDSEDIVEHILKLYRGQLPGYENKTPDRSLDGLHGGIMGTKFPWMSFMAIKETFSDRNAYIKEEVSEYINGTFFRWRDYCPMPGMNDENALSGYGPTFNNPGTGSLEGECGWISYLAAVMDPLQKQNWLNSLRSPWMVRSKPWVFWAGYADNYEKATDAFSFYSTGGRWEQILDDGEEYVTRGDGNMYNWFYFFIGNKIYCTDPEWKQAFRNYIAAYQGLADDRTSEYFGCYNYGDVPDYEDYGGDTYNVDGIGDPLSPMLEIIDLESVHDLCITGEIFPAAASYLAYREGKMIRGGLYHGYSNRYYTNTYLMGRYCRIAPDWIGNSPDNINVGMAEVIKPGSLVESGYLNDGFKVNLEISTNIDGYVVLGFSEMTPRCVFGSDDGINWVSYGLQYSPYVFDNGASYNHYRVEDPEGQHMNIIMKNEFFDKGLTNWIQSGDCVFTTVEPGTVNISGSSAEIRVTPSSSLALSSLRKTLKFTNDYTDTQYIVRGNGYVASEGAPGEGYMVFEWDADSDPGNGVLNSTESVHINATNRFEEFRIDTVKPAAGRYIHMYFVVDPVQTMALNKRYIFDNISIVRIGAPLALNNSGFEEGNLSGWNVNDGGQNFSITTEPDEVMEGSYALKVTTGSEDHGDDVISTITSPLINIAGDYRATRYIIRAKVKTKTQGSTIVKLNGRIIPNVTADYDRAGIVVEPNFDGDYAFTLRNCGNSTNAIHVGNNDYLRLILEVTRKRGDVNTIDEIIIDDIRIMKARAWPKPLFYRSFIYGD